MKLIEKLMNEHQLILRYIEMMQDLTRKNSGSDVAIRNSFIQKYGLELIEFIQQYADHYHHGKEEDILFVYMNRPETLLHCNPISRMLYEHHTGREIVKNMIKSLNEVNYDLFCENVAAYGILLQEHIAKEDQVLYPMAINGITSSHKIEIQKEFEKAEERLNLEKKYDQFYQERLDFLNDQL